MTQRPNPMQWLAYAFGAGLPARNRDWVLYDVTTRTWALRHFARVTVQLAPVLLALYLLLPGEPWVRAGAVLAGALLGFFYAAAYLYEAAEHRAVKAGHPRGSAAATRAAGRAGELRDVEDRYVRQWRAPAGGGGEP